MTFTEKEIKNLSIYNDFDCYNYWAGNDDCIIDNCVYMMVEWPDLFDKVKRFFGYTKEMDENGDNWVDVYAYVSPYRKVEKLHCVYINNEDAETQTEEDLFIFPANQTEAHKLYKAIVNSMDEEQRESLWKMFKQITDSKGTEGLHEYNVVLSFSGTYDALVDAVDERQAKEMIISDLYNSKIDDCDVEVCATEVKEMKK